MKILLFLFTCFFIFLWSDHINAQSKNDVKLMQDKKIIYENQQSGSPTEVTINVNQNFLSFSSQNSEVLFDDNQNKCKISRSFFTEFKDDIFLIKQCIKSGIFYELDDLNNTVTTTEKIDIEGTKFIEIVTFKSDKKHIKLIKMLVTDHKLKEFKPLYYKYLKDFLF